jgi:hypothetical protein
MHDVMIVAMHFELHAALPWADKVKMNWSFGSTVTHGIKRIVYPARMR